MSTETKQFEKPTTVSRLELAFGGDIEKLLPDWDSIPEDFRRSRTKWNKLFSTWFFTGLPENTTFLAKEGIDADAALAHVSAIMKSWQPKHEHKEAGCAYLMSLWFEEISIPAT